MTPRAGDTPLHLACEEGRLEVARLLVEAGASVTATNAVGKTPLDWVTDPTIKRTLSSRAGAIAAATATGGVASDVA